MLSDLTFRLHNNLTFARQIQRERPRTPDDPAGRHLSIAITDLEAVEARLGMALAAEVSEGRGTAQTVVHFSEQEFQSLHRLARMAGMTTLEYLKQGVEWQLTRGTP